LASDDLERIWTEAAMAYRGIIPAFEDPRETTNTSVRTDDVPVKIRTMHPQTISLDSYCYNDLCMSVKRGKGGI
jgi:hypothetical protein